MVLQFINIYVIIFSLSIRDVRNRFDRLLYYFTNQLYFKDLKKTNRYINAYKSTFKMTGGWFIIFTPIVFIKKILYVSIT